MVKPLNAVKKKPPSRRKNTVAKARRTAAPSQKKSAKFFIDKLARYIFKGSYKSSVVKGGNRRAKTYIVSRVAGPMVASKLDALRKRLDANLADYSVEFAGTLNPKKPYQDLEIRIGIMSEIPDNNKIRVGVKKKTPVTASNESDLKKNIKSYLETAKPIGVLY